MDALYSFQDYRDYLSHWAEESPKGGHGSRKRISEYLRCQSAFISQVLHKTTHLTLEHAERLNEFLEHDALESDYFLLLVQMQRAGSKKLQDYFRKKVEEIHARRLVLKNRIKGSEREITDAVKQKYYSQWYFGAIRLLLTIPAMQNKESLVRHLKLPRSTINEAIAFLEESGFISRVGDDRFIVSEQHLHLGNDSPLIVKHHLNWRLKAMQSLELEREHDLHYSLGMTISQSDVGKLKAMVVEFVESVQKIARPSEAQVLCGLCIDFFEP